VTCVTFSQKSVRKLVVGRFFNADKSMGQNGLLVALPWRDDRIDVFFLGNIEIKQDWPIMF
jgi:hypothetical protein